MELQYPAKGIVMAAQTQENWTERYKISFKWKDLNLFIYLSGEFGLKNLMVFNIDINREISKQKLNSVTIDFSEVDYLDSAAALALVQIKKDTIAKNIQCQLVNLNDESKGIFSVIHEDALNHLPFKSLQDNDDFIRKIGQSSLDIAT